jgi:acyl carrier protein
MAVADRIRQLIVDHLDMPTPPGFDERTPLFEGGLGMDSFTAVELITLIEKHFGIEFNVEDIRPEHFTDVNALAELVGTYLSAP